MDVRILDYVSLSSIGFFLVIFSLSFFLICAMIFSIKFECNRYAIAIILSLNFLFSVYFSISYTKEVFSPPVTSDDLVAEASNPCIKDGILDIMNREKSAITYHELGNIKDRCEYLDTHKSILDTQYSAMSEIDSTD